MRELRLLRATARVLIVGALVAGGLALRPSQPLALVPSEPGGAIGADDAPVAAHFDSIIRASTSEAPFRANRTPAPVRYDPLGSDPLLDPGPPPPPRPRLRLTGIVWGDRPSAVIEGLPGASGPRVVQGGDVIGELRVRRVGPEQVTVVGMDTVWVLEVQTPWE